MKASKVEGVEMLSPSTIKSDYSEDIVTGNFRKDVLHWLSLPWPDTEVFKSRAWLFHLKLGGMERLSVLVQSMDLDYDEDGILTEAETDNEKSSKVIDQVLGFILNSGVVGALIFSVLFSTLQNSLEASPESADFFGDVGIDALSGLYYILIYTGLFSSLWLIKNFVQQCLFITSWLPNTELKLWFLSAQSPLQLTVVVSYACLGAIFLSVPCCVAVAVTPWCGLVTLIFSTAIVSQFLSNFLSENGDAKIIKQIHASLRKKYKVA